MNWIKIEIGTVPNVSREDGKRLVVLTGNNKPMMIKYLSHFVISKFRLTHYLILPKL
jgi:hypothetical protein